MTDDVHLAQTRSGDPACRVKDPAARRSRDLSLITCPACIASRHYASRQRTAVIR